MYPLLILILILLSLSPQIWYSDINTTSLYDIGNAHYSYVPDQDTIHKTIESLSLQNPNRWLLLGEIKVQEGTYAGAELAYREGLNISHRDPNLLNSLGLSLISQGRYAEAIDPLIRATEEKQHAAPFYTNLGTAYALQEQYSSAIVSYQKAVQLSPSYLLAWNNLGLAYLKNGNGRSAQESYLASLAIQPDDPVAWINLGHALTLEHHYTEAESAYRYALTLHPSETDRKEAERSLNNVTQNLTKPSPVLDSKSADRINSALHSSGIVNPPVIYPSIIPIPNSSRQAEIPVNMSFSVRNELHTVQADVNQSLFLGAQAAYKGVLFNIDPPVGTREERRRFYTSFIREPYNQPLIASIHDSIQEIHTKTGNTLSFAEIATAYVRSIGTDLTSTELKYPAETLVLHAGDCDDKSILLAAILLHHGNDVAIFEFPSHVAVGVSGIGPEYRNSGYTIIEMTDELPIGTTRPEYETHPVLVLPILSGDSAWMHKP